MRIVTLLFTLSIISPALGEEPQVKLLHTFEAGRPGAYSNVAFSPDGKLLAAGDHFYKPEGGSERSVKIWDVAQRKMIASLQGDRGYSGNEAYSVAFSADGKTLAVAGAEVTLWDVATAKKKSRFPGHYPLAFSADGQTLAALGGTETENNQVILWDVVTGKEKASLKEESKGSVFSLALSPDAKWLATGRGISISNGQSGGGEVVLWNLQTGKIERTMLCMVHVWAVAFSPDSKAVASADVYGNIHLWDTTTGRQTITFQKFNRRSREEDINGTYALAFSPDGATLAAGTRNGLKLWDVKSGKSVGAAADRNASTTWGVAFHPDGKTLATAGCQRTIGSTHSIQGDEALRLWQWTSGK